MGWRQEVAKRAQFQRDFHSFHRDVERCEKSLVKDLTYFEGIVRLQMVRDVLYVSDRAGDSQSGLK